MSSCRAIAFCVTAFDPAIRTGSERLKPAADYPAKEIASEILEVSRRQRCKAISHIKSGPSCRKAEGERVASNSTITCLTDGFRATLNCPLGVCPSFG